MASTDWTSISSGSGVFAVVADPTAPSPPDAMQISAVTSGGQFFQNITGGPFKNSRISGWVNQAQSASQEFLLALRSLNTTFSAAPATYFVASIAASTSTMVRIRIDAIVAGVVTTIASIDVNSVNGSPILTWQQYQFSAFNSGANILLRLAQWNGFAFAPLVDCAAPIASFPTLDAAGSGRFGANFSVTGSMRMDDVNFYSLA